MKEYQNKQQNKQQQQQQQRVVQGQSPLLMNTQSNSPLAHPSSSPIHLGSTPQSPMMSPSASSPMTQHSSPLNSPNPVITHSPGSIANLMQSPTSNMSPVQPSPRIGTPHSQQGDSSPGPIQSPSQVCLPPPAPRMTSPQHRRIVTSPLGYTGEIRTGTGQTLNLNQIRFTRQPMDSSVVLQQRVRLSSPVQNFPQRNNTPSPLSSPPPQQMNLNQQLMQKQLQQGFVQQQSNDSNQQTDANIVNSQRAAQLLQQRQLILRQQQLAQQQLNNQQPLTPQQHHLLLQQQLLKQQQLQHIQAQNRMNQQQSSPAGSSPLPPKSPLINNQVQNIMSPHSIHSQPPSPMPPRSPMVNYNNNQPPSSPAMPRSPAVSQPPNSPMMHAQHQPPSSPMARSPMIGQMQSPMSIRRPPSASSSPAMPDRPTSVENPSTPRSAWSDSDHGGGNPHNPVNPLPIPPGFKYTKLGLMGGSPMWGGLGRGAKRLPVPADNKDEENNKAAVSENSNTQPKMKKESHLSKVSILKKKSPIKTNLQSFAMSKVGSLVSVDYNEFDDSSSTPPVTPPPSTSKAFLQRKIAEQQAEAKEHAAAAAAAASTSPERKQTQEDMMDYDDDNDNTLVSTEVSLSSAAQTNDGDDITVIETFSNELTDVMSSPLESDQIADEFVLFPGNMVVDISGEAQYSDKDEEEEEEYGGQLVNIHDKNMHIVNVAIQSPTTSEEEMIMQGKTKTVNIVSSNHLLTMTETPESPEQDDMQADPSPESTEDVLTDFEESEIVIIDPAVKSPEEQISTKEDFEELIDEGSKKEKIIKSDIVNSKHISEMHKYTSNIYNFPAKATPTNIVQAGGSRMKHIVTQKIHANLGGQPRISLIASPIKNITTAKGATAKMPELINRGVKIIPSTIASSVANIILPLKTTVRSNLANVSKIVTSVPQAITIVTASTSQIASILPSHFTVPVISASAVSKLPNVKVIDKPSSSLALTAHDSVPKKIFEDEPDGNSRKIKDAQEEKLTKPDTKTEILDKTNIGSQEENKNQTLGAENSKPQTISNGKQSITEDGIKSSPGLSKTTSVLIHGTPELKMTAQIIQETQTGVQITARSDGTTASYITAQAVEGLDNNTNDLDNKSVVISIPSPTPSQEQMLDNIARQALENRRREGGFESFEDMLSMIENITGEPPTILEDNDKESSKTLEKVTAATKKEETQQIVPPTSTTVSSVMSQLSPLSQPTELTTNMANASQQLRTLLSSLHTTTVTTSSNVETVVKSVTNTEKVSTSISSPITVSSRNIQQVERNTSAVSASNTVIVPNFKQRTSLVTTGSSQKTSNAIIFSTSSASSPSQKFQVTSVSNLLASRASGGIQLMPDHPKLPLITTVASTHTVTTPTSKTAVSTATNSPPKSLSLDAMLQSHPAATMPQTSPSTITTASLLGSPIGIMKPGFGSSLAHAHPQVSLPITTTVQQNIQSSSATSSVINTSGVRSIVTTTNLLHTQLTKTTKTIVTESQDSTNDVKVEASAESTVNFSSNSQILNLSRSETSGCTKLSTTHSTTNRVEDSQNVLLKQLLQNTACASTAASTITANTTNTSSSSTPPITPILPIVPNLEAQLARPVPPTPTSLLPPILQNDPPATTASKTVQRNVVVSRETSFVSKAVCQNPPISIQQQTPSVSTSQPLHIDTKRCLPPSRTPSRDDLLSPPTPRSTCSQDSSLQTPPLSIKKEMPSLTTSQQILPQDVKKELVDESSQHSEVSDHSRPDIQMKDELMDLDPTSDKSLIDQKEELKKLKRRAYQQKRRQNQIMGKDAAVQPKKRPRKGSKVEEDYDTYIDGVLHQLRTLPPMTVSEPILNKNFAVVPMFGCGDLSKLGGKDYDSRFGDLTGTYGNAFLPDVSDFYSTKPYGDAEPLPEKTPASTQRGFYDQEFPLIKFNVDEDKKYDLFCREDSPDSIISSSSPECHSFEPTLKFPGLRLISEDEDEETDDAVSKMRLSPVVPLIQPIPIRLKGVGPYLKDYTETVNMNRFN